MGSGCSHGIEQKHIVLFAFRQAFIWLGSSSESVLVRHGGISIVFTGF